MENKSTSIISLRQLFFLAMAQMGGAIVIYIPGTAEAGRDVWISSIIASIVAYMVIYSHYLPQSLCPGYSMTKILNKYWGRLLGGIVNFYYLTFCFILCCLIVSDVFYFGKVTLPETPGFIFIIFLLVPAIYAVKLGIEVIGRLVEFTIPVLAFCFIILFLLVIPKAEYENIVPIMSDGIKPVLRGSIPKMNFPFAQILPIAFLYKYIQTDSQKGNKIIKTLFTSILVATILVTVRSFAAAAVFEEETLKTLTFPPFSAIRLIQVGDVIERLDPVFLGVFYLSTFFKFVITYIVICQIISEFFNAGESKHFALPVAVLIGVSMPFLIPRFDIIGATVVPYFFLSLPLFLPIPILLFITIKLKDKLKDKKKKTFNQ